MSKPSFKVINGTAPRSEVRSKLINRLAALPHRPRGESRYFKYNVNPASPEAMFMVNWIVSNPGHAMSEIVHAMTIEFGHDFTDHSKRCFFGSELSRILADSPEGHVLVKNFLVGITPLGAKPRWFRDLSKAEQTKVPRRTGVDQEIDVGYEQNTNLPVVIGPSYETVRQGYVGVTGLGGRWISPSKVATIKKTDTKLAIIAVEDAKHRTDLEAALLEAVEAKTALDALIASNKASVAASNMTNSAVQRMLATGSPIVVPQAKSEIDDLREMMATQTRMFADFMASQAQPQTAEAAPKAKRRSAAKGATKGAAKARKAAAPIDVATA